MRLFSVINFKGQFHQIGPVINMCHFRKLLDCFCVSSVRMNKLAASKTSSKDNELCSRKKESIWHLSLRSRINQIICLQTLSAFMRLCSESDFSIFINECGDSMSRIFFSRLNSKSFHVSHSFHNNNNNKKSNVNNVSGIRKKNSNNWSGRVK